MIVIFQYLHQACLFISLTTEMFGLPPLGRASRPVLSPLLGGKWYAIVIVVEILGDICHYYSSLSKCSVICGAE